MSGFNLLNSTAKLTVVQNNIDQLQDVTISSIADLQNQLDMSSTVCLSMAPFAFGF